MKIIQVHNYYQQAGGEDVVVEAERKMLEEQGNIVVPFYKTNDDIPSGGQDVGALGGKLIGLLSVSLKTIWNHQTYREFRKLLQTEKPDVVHCHNTFPLISPSIYWACAKEKVPVVQTLHNYRLLCLNSNLFRVANNRHEALGIRHAETVTPTPSAQRLVPSSSGSICELCVKKTFKWPGLKYGCYRDSKAGSLVVALMLLFHKLIGTWSKKVTAYIALTEFQKQKMIEGGLPGDKIFVKPNFIQTAKGDENHERHEEHEKKTDAQCPAPDAPYALFVGRLSPEKGCDVLIRAWSQYLQKFTPNAQCPTPALLIVGDGPERESLKNLSSSICPPSSVRFLGRKPREDVLPLMKDARFLVFPSMWFETFGLTVLEAGSVETPSLISSPTTTASLVNDGESGVLFEMGNIADLSDKLSWAFAHSEELAELGKQACGHFDVNYSQQTNYMNLMAIYEAVA